MVAEQKKRWRCWLLCGLFFNCISTDVSPLRSTPLCQCFFATLSDNLPRWIVVLQTVRLGRWFIPWDTFMVDHETNTVEECHGCWAKKRWCCGLLKWAFQHFTQRMLLKLQKVAFSPKKGTFFLLPFFHRHQEHGSRCGKVVQHDRSDNISHKRLHVTFIIFNVYG